MKHYEVTFYFGSGLAQLVACQAESNIVALVRAAKLFRQHDETGRDPDAALRVDICEVFK